ncbi:MAG: helix-turn-helix transcriptional regulator [Gemmatimonadetes bacterium]|nr:helix-turn-helix transcriptional regulator [Gemmatimonadota bacterium]MBI2615942.1 helix-turn-helix transcriptional regulator [Gemmatimonadota bacterium]MBI3082566.1 helix-turn-helix transcriptional regulator [Gemmatimonadota bacterium]
MRGQKPPPPGYPRQLRTVGDDIRKRRLDSGLLQREVAGILGVTVDTVRNWEVGRNRPSQRQWPRIIEFLGYVPSGATGDSSPLGRPPPPAPEGSAPESASRGP